MKIKSCIRFGAYYRSSLEGLKGRIFNFLIKLLGYPIYFGDRIRAYHVMSILNPSHEDLILDAGCGSGVYGIECALKGAEIVGVDISKEGIKEAIKVLKQIKNNVRIHFIMADLCKLPIRSGIFTKSILIDVLEHIVDDRTALTNVIHSLKCGGQLIIHVPHRNPNRILLRGNRLKPQYFGHVREGYDIKSLILLIKNCGTQPLKFKYTFMAPTSLLWEISLLMSKYKVPIRHILFPFFFVAGLIGERFHAEKGSGILVIAKKGRNKAYQ